MFNRYFLPFFSILALTAGLNLIGEAQGLYNAFVWYDIMMHALGGAWAALLVLWLARVFRIRLDNAGFVLIGAFAVGIGWEALEILLGFAYTTDPGYAIDTAMDLCMDMIGAVAAVLIDKRMKKIS